MTAGRVVIIPVERYDRRAVAAMEFAARIPADRVVALHVTDAALDIQELADRWMDAETGVPMRVVDSQVDLGRDIRSLIEEELGNGASEVLVVLGRVALSRSWQMLLHRHRAVRLGRTLRPLRGVKVAFVNVPL